MLAGPQKPCKNAVSFQTNELIGLMLVPQKTRGQRLKLSIKYLGIPRHIRAQAMEALSIKVVTSPLGEK